MALNFRKADRLRKFFNGSEITMETSNESCVSAATTCTSAFGRLLWERFFTVNESQQTVETDTLWLSNIHALNFRKPGHLRKYCNNENFPIYGNCSELSHSQRLDYVALLSMHAARQQASEDNSIVHFHSDMTSIAHFHSKVEFRNGKK